MNINSIKYNENTYHSYSPSRHRYRKECGVANYEDKLRGSIAFNGSRASEISNAAVKVYNNLGETIPDKIAKTKGFKKLLDLFEENTVVSQALVSLVVAGILRPATNLGMAGKDDKLDAIHAAAHAIASAVIGFIISSVIMLPFDKAFKKIKENPENYLKGLEETFGVKEIGRRKLEKSKAYKNISKFAQMFPDTIVMGIPKALLTIALIPPILKYVFGIEKKSANKKQPVNTQYIQQFMNKSAFQAFKGGLNASKN